MKRKTLDLVFSIGGTLVAVLLLLLGLVLQNQASFAKSYVKDQLSEQRISFTPVEGLEPEEKKTACLTKYAGKPLTTGKQAECYANEYIGLHVKDINEGKTYAETSSASRKAREAADEAAASNSPDADKLEGAAKELAGKTDGLFRGETLRGLLLTSYGFSVFGERAQQAALVAFLVAGVLALASIAGFIHALGKRGEEVVHLA